MIELIELDNGDLEILVTDKEEFENLLTREFNDERHYLLEMVDSGRYLGNDWHVPFDLQMTEMPAIGYGGICLSDEAEEENWPDDYEKLWGYDNYMITSYLDELKENGKVIFKNFS